MNCDLLLVGGGLANSLIAWRLRQVRPEVTVRILERGEMLGGNHTWSFHSADVTPAQLDWLGPLIEKSWPYYDIVFPNRRRRFHGGYHSISSGRLHREISAALGDAVVLNAQVTSLQPQQVSLADGRRWSAEGVIDARGDPGGTALDVRYQKFVGQVVELEAPVALQGPILMDATVEQLDGYRFMYTLPFAPDRVLIEDTRYSDGPELDREPMRAAIAAYARDHGWRIRHVLREEEGVLPVVLGGDLRAYLADAPDVPRAGLRAGLFHYTTGFSLPEAVSLAEDLSRLPDLSSPALAQFIRARSFSLWRRGRFFRLLNRMLFLAGPPQERYRVLEHFYRLPPDVVARFYAGRPSWPDRLRILSGKPPVPVGRALGSLFASRAEAVQ
ncbi:MAG TPA: lycopene cyclase [Chromatiales bacterium]|nr:lycopene cyclase [Chromatiales bacterium]